MSPFNPSTAKLKILVLDEEPSWTEAYCRWQGGSNALIRKKWRAITLSELKQWLENA